MIWPFLLAIGLVVLGAARIAQDHRAAWVAAWCAAGIALMQLPVPEPARWIWAFALWTFLALLVGVRRGCAAPAFLLWLVPAGYAGLAAIDFGTLPAGTGWRNAAFGVTEIGWLAALLVGGRRLPRGLWRMARRRRAARSGAMVRGRSVPMAARKTVD